MMCGINHSVSKRHKRSKIKYHFKWCYKVLSSVEHIWYARFVCRLYVHVNRNHRPNNYSISWHCQRPRLSVPNNKMECRYMIARKSYHHRILPFNRPFAHLNQPFNVQSLCILVSCANIYLCKSSLLALIAKKSCLAAASTQWALDTFFTQMSFSHFKLDQQVKHLKCPQPNDGLCGDFSQPNICTDKLIHSEKRNWNECVSIS